MFYVLPNIPESLSRAICADLIRNLPAPADDTPEQLALRDERAITVLAHYIPLNAAEAELAADIVTAEFYNRDIEAHWQILLDFDHRSCLATSGRMRDRNAVIAWVGGRFWRKGNRAGPSQ